MRPIERAFKEREQKVMDLIKSYNLEYHEIGIFGSYARGTFKATSDIDFYIVVDKKPVPRVSGNLREDADMLGADIVFITPEHLEAGNSLLIQNIKRDRKVLVRNEQEELLWDSN